MKRNRILFWLTAFGVLSGMVLIGCHAGDDDVAGQAGELSDAIRREHAVENLRRAYSAALSAAEGDRTAAGPQGVADDCVEALSRTYVEHPEDTQNGRRILDLLVNMEDQRAMPAFTKALDWRPDVTEEHAVSAAQAIQRMEIGAEHRAAVVTALSSALDRIQSNRGVDNRMRQQFIRALGLLGDRAATPILTKIATRISEDQHFLINRLAAEQVGVLGDPAAIDAMIRGLFLFAPSQPQLRMNDVAGQALVQIGEPALEPLLAVLRGENENTGRLVTQYIAAVRLQDEAFANGMNQETILTSEACMSLGQLGLRGAVGPMVERITPLTSLSGNAARDADPELFTRAMACTIGLVSINRNEADTVHMRSALTGVYSNAQKVQRPQILVAMQHSYDEGLLDFLYDEARRPEDELPDIRVLALQAYAFLANRSESQRIQALIERESAIEGGGLAPRFREYEPALTAAQECDEDLACWIGKLGDSDNMVARKAAYMVARYGRGDEAAMTGLIAQLGHSETAVRVDMLYALDWAASGGSQAGVDALHALREEEEGRSSWNRVKEVALAVAARLQGRIAHP